MLGKKLSPSPGTPQPRMDVPQCKAISWKEGKRSYQSLSPRQQRFSSRACRSPEGPLHGGFFQLQYFLSLAGTKQGRCVIRMHARGYKWRTPRNGQSAPRSLSLVPLNTAGSLQDRQAASKDSLGKAMEFGSNGTGRNSRNTTSRFDLTVRLKSHMVVCAGTTWCIHTSLSIQTSLLLRELFIMMICQRRGG